MDKNIVIAIVILVVCCCSICVFSIFGGGGAYWLSSSKETTTPPPTTKPPTSKRTSTPGSTTPTSGSTTPTPGSTTPIPTTPVPTLSVLESRFKEKQENKDIAGFDIQCFRGNKPVLECATLCSQNETCLGVNMIHPNGPWGNEGGCCLKTVSGPLSQANKIDFYERKCEDYNTKCGEWANQGECKANPDYMLKSCKQSCNVCGKSDDEIKSLTTQYKSLCEDANVNCAAWASQGECTANPGYMLKSCKKSCNVCS